MENNITDKAKRALELYKEYKDVSTGWDEAECIASVSMNLLPDLAQAVLDLKSTNQDLEEKVTYLKARADGLLPKYLELLKAAEEKLIIAEEALTFYADKGYVQGKMFGEFLHRTQDDLIRPEGYRAREALEKIRGEK